MSRNTTWLLMDSRDIGGIETHVTLLCECLCRRGLDARIVLLDDHGPHPMAPVWHARNLRVDVAAGASGLARALLRDRPSLVHSHGYKAGLIVRPIAALYGIPVVSTFHAGEPSTTKVRLYSALDRASARLSKNIAVNAVIARPIPGNASVIPNFITTATNSDRSVDGPIAFVGRLSHEKGPDLFLALARVRRETQFVIYGDGPMGEALRAETPPNVIFKGRVASMDAEWPNIGMLCMPSRHEGLPLAALEAHAHGIPVAAFDVGTMQMAVIHGSTGWVVPKGDLGALDTALSEWLGMSVSERAKISKSSIVHVTQTYGEDRIIPQILSVYDRARNLTGSYQ